MSRLFSEHTVRRVESLNGMWMFRIDPNDVGEKEKWFLGLSNAVPTAVPSVWNEEKDLLEYEGAAWYEKRLYTKGGTLRFCFGGVMNTAKVWLDGEYLGSHNGGYCEFDFIVNGVSEGEHTVTVRADNRLDEYTIPQPMVDWYHYGGIIRDVTVETLVGLSVLNHRLEYTLSEDLSTLYGKFFVECYNAGGKERENLKVSVGDKTVFDAEVSVPENQLKEIELPEFSITEVRLWDVGSPELYTVKFISETDDLFDRVGFRRVEVKDKKILLNNKPIEIRGVNRHEEYPGFGFAFPLSRMKKDVDLILDLGCNSIRGSHYPNSRKFMDYLDSVGILFWSEIPIWGCGFEQKTLGEARIVELGLEMHREMVKYYYNHPSIIFFGMHNEILSDTEEGLEMTKKYYAFLKENGGNRLVVYASNHALTDISLKYTDVVCINKYIGWYEGKSFSDWKDFLKEFDAYAESLGIGHLPIVMSEFGGAAIYGFHDTDCPKWSEEQQAELLEYCLTVFHNHSSVCGTFVWQFCDIRTCAEMGFSRARGFNNKGIMNEYRRPKAAYYAVKRCYNSFMKEN